MRKLEYTQPSLKSSNRPGGEKLNKAGNDQHNVGLCMYAVGSCTTRAGFLVYGGRAYPIYELSLHSGQFGQRAQHL